MSNKQINQLPSGVANKNSIVAADNATLTATEKVTLGDIAKLGTELSDSKNVYVDGARTDSYTADGSFLRPFKTVQAAVDYVETLTLYAPSTLEPLFGGIDTGAVINILPYSYADENIIISKPRIYLKGLHSNNGSFVFCKLGRVTINSTVDTGGVQKNQYTFSGLLIQSNLGNNVMTIAGDVDCRVMIEDCQLWSETGKVLVITHTGNPRIFANNVAFNNVAANVTTIEKANSNGWLSIKNSEIYFGDSTAVVYAGATLDIISCTVIGAGSEIINMSGTGVLSVGNSTLSTTKADSNGVVLQNTAILNAVQNVFSVPSGSGYVITGPAGTVYAHSFNSFAPSSLGGGNVKIKNTVTPIALTTALTPTA